MNPHVVDITLQNAQQYLIEESRVRPVLVDFWADWCAPCKALMPLLEKLATEYNGAFLLAKVNADQQQEITAQFGIRSLPTVVVMKDGQPVNAFQGAQPETVIRQLLDEYLPKPWDLKIQEAEARIEAGDLPAALALLREAHEDSGKRSDIGLMLAQVLLMMNRAEDAGAILKAIPMKDQDSLYQQLLAQVELQQEAAKAPEIQELEARLNADPDNREIAYELAVQFSQHQFQREALDLLLNLLKKDLNFRDGGAKKIYLDILAALGKGDPLAVEYQRKIYNLLY
ncbi:MAG: thioredoxin [Porticoccaceae bacterium]|nr:thioredoxin [Porticoccaceae bacterium]